MKKNTVVTTVIEDMSESGEGIGKADGFTLFVKDALIGEKAEVRITKRKKNYGFARLERILEESPFRVESRCPHHRRCGGCQLQALSYEKQLEFKEKKIRNHLIRLGGFDSELVDACMEPVVGMENPYRYRNKAQFPFGKDKEGAIVTGFYAARTHSIIPNLDCALGAEENEAVLKSVLEAMKETGVTAYEEESHSGLLRHVLIRKGFATGELMVCLILNGKKLPHQAVFIDKLCKLKGMTSIFLNFNQERTNVILGKEGKTIWGKERIRDSIGGIVYEISPRSFYQVNPVQTEKLYGLALEYAELTGKETVWDLYCGIGTISLFLAKNARQVYGVEIVPEAVEDAKRNAALNGITNAEFFTGKAEEIVPDFYAGKGLAGASDTFPGKEKQERYPDDAARRPEVMVVDPPRKGCDRVLLDTMLQMEPERIVYVSCDSATLARDLRVLCDGGYALERVRGVDQFPETVHVETVVCLSK